MHKKFLDEKGNMVTLAFTKSTFPIEAKHVLIICRLENQWLLTNHSQRGWEFPGGKIENGESAEEAAIREVDEETGGKIRRLIFIGEYFVDDRVNPFVKQIYFADIEKIRPKGDYMETKGPVLIEGDLVSILKNQEFSFIMKDEVVPMALAKIDEII
ncbi:RNA deprotection pyrophosphohydrolase [Bacillus sp. FJAT-50079]|uniref:RNA deprotection pyrophosphohydrolase n=1 Tax=Bacillus sp. FJAT-50079 TaxID=2833577 RepID=UPI001BC956EF|nr:nucleoside triphosphatase YtkD [Bacillus sp. FJAT-50079]MBS4208587.1 nucleoside triphosphatase YtkD [Bacillus sp. FJAT-50079]